MTIATRLAAALAPVLGPAEETIHTAVPPLHLGGGADVVEFRRAPAVPGVVLVSAGLATHGRGELVLCTRAPEPWAAPLLSRLAAAALQRRFVRNGTVPLGDAGGPFPALAFTGLPGLPRVDLRPEAGSAHFLLAIGMTRAELEACRSHGTPHVVALLRRAGAFPYSDPARASVVDATSLGPSPLAHPGLSPAGREGLRAVLDGQPEDVEALRNTFPKTDLAHFAAIYPQLVSFEQKSDLVNLVTDSVDPALVPLWRGYARDALQETIGESTGEHVALSGALAGLDGDLRRFDAYYDDLAAALARAKEIAGA